MSKMVLSKDKDKGQIKDVVFCYIKIQDGDFKYNSTVDKEFSVDCVVDKATAKAFKKVFPKNGYKEIDTTDFERIYKVKPVYPDSDEQFVIKLKANATFTRDFPDIPASAGDRVPYEWGTRPKLYVPTEGGVKDVTMTVLASNGSKGDAAFKITTNTYGSFPKLSGLLVKDLIEYIPQDAGSDFGDVIGGFDAGSGDMQQTATNRDEAIEEKEEPKVEEDLNSDVEDLPF